MLAAHSPWIPMWKALAAAWLTGAAALEASAVLAPAAPGLAELLLSINTSAATWASSCRLRVEFSESSLRLPEDVPSLPGCQFLSELPALPAPESCEVFAAGFELQLGCLRKSSQYHLVLRVFALATSAPGQLGGLNVSLSSEGLSEMAAAEVQGEVLAPASSCPWLEVQLPRYLDPGPLEGETMALAFTLRHDDTELEPGDQLLLTPSPLLLWNPSQSACTVVSDSPLVCRWVALGVRAALALEGFNSSLPAAANGTSFELRLRLPLGGATDHRPWRGLLRRGAGACALDAAVVLGPQLRAAARPFATAAGLKGAVRLDLDPGVDLCMDPLAALPGQVRIVPPLALMLPSQSAEGPSAAPVDCLRQAGGFCTMTLSPSEWRRGLPCLFRGVVYTVEWEDVTTIGVKMEISGWHIEVDYPVLTGGELPLGWSALAAALPTTAGPLPFLAARFLRPVLGGQQRRETLLLVRFRTGTSQAYQDLLPLRRPSRLRLSWDKGLAFSDFQGCDLVVESRNLPLLLRCERLEGFWSAVELHLDGVLQSEEEYDLLLPVVSSSFEGAMKLEVLREDDAEDDVAEWGEVPCSGLLLDGASVFDELGPVLNSNEVFTTDEDVLGLAPWQSQMAVGVDARLQILEVDTLGGPQVRSQQRCDGLASSCRGGALAKLPGTQLALCDGTRILWLELASEIRLMGRFGGLPQLGSSGLGSCNALAASAGEIFVADGANHRVMQLQTSALRAAAVEAVELPEAALLALSGPLQVIYGYYDSEVLVGQQGQHPLPARLLRIRLSDRALLGWVFLRYSSFTDPNQIFLLTIDELTAMAVVQGEVWVTGPSLLMRLDPATLRSRDFLIPAPEWGRITAMTVYSETLVLGTANPALVIEVPLVGAALADAVASVWHLAPGQGAPSLAAAAAAATAGLGSSMAVLGTDSAPPRLLFLPSQLVVPLAGNRTTALAVLPAVPAAPGGRLAVAVGQGADPAALHLLHLPVAICAELNSSDDSEDNANATQDCGLPVVVRSIPLESGLEISSLVYDGANLQAALVGGSATSPRSFAVEISPELDMDMANASEVGEGRLALAVSPGALWALLLPPSGPSRFSMLSQDDPAVAVGMSLTSVFGLRIPGPIDTGYEATTGNGGLSSPEGIAYADLPEPCLYVADTGNHRVVQLAVSLRLLRYMTHFGESGFPGSGLSRLDTPAAVAVGDGLRVYVLDAGNRRVVVLATGDVLGQLSYIQSLALPFAVTGSAHLVLQPGAGLGPATLWAAWQRNLMRWSLATPARWQLLAPAEVAAEAVVPLELDFEVTEGQLAPGVAGGLLLTAAPALSWQLTAESLAPLCEAEATSSSGARMVIGCEFLGGGPGLPYPSVLLRPLLLEGRMSLSVRCRLPAGAAPNVFDVRSGAWTLALLGQGYGVLRSRLLPPPAIPALAVPAAPRLSLPLVVAPPQGRARLGFDVTVRALLSPGALALGGPLPGRLALLLPESFQLEEAEGCVVESPSSCVLELSAGVRLQADAPWPLLLRLRAAAEEVWGLRLESAGPLKAVSISQTAGVKFEFGTLIPSSWPHFPTVDAWPLILGPALLEVSFRPYSPGTTSIIIVGPETTVLTCRRLQLSACGALAPSLAPRCAAALSSVQLWADFAAWTTYQLNLEVQHLPGSWLPDEAAEEVLRPVREANMSGDLPWWRISFEDDTRSLATARWIPGYPVWPQGFNFSLDFVSLALAPLPAGPALLEVTLAVAQELGGTTTPRLRLYAPAGLSFDCASARFELVPRLALEPLPAEGTCRGSGLLGAFPYLELRLGAFSVLLAEMEYSFRVPVLLPSDSEQLIWYASLEAGPLLFGSSARSRTWRRMELSLALGAWAQGGLAPLQVALKTSRLLASQDGERGCIEIVAAPLFAFSAPCLVRGALPADTEVRNLPASSCEGSDRLARLCLAPGMYVQPGVEYRFVLLSVQIPAGTLGRRLAASSWTARMVDATGREVESYLQEDLSDPPVTVPRLEAFSFSAASSSLARRLGSEYVAAFTFKASATGAEPIFALQVTAPSGFHFTEGQDCSPDSSAAVLPLPAASAAVESGPRQLAVGWCRAARFQPAALLPNSEMHFEEDALRSARLGLPKPVVDFRERYLFRVAVQHPDHRPRGIETWALSVLGSDWAILAQQSDLQAYELVGDLQGSLEASNPLLSIGGEEENNVTVHFKLSTNLPAGGELQLLLADGFTFPGPVSPSSVETSSSTSTRMADEEENESNVSNTTSTTSTSLNTSSTSTTMTRTSTRTSTTTTSTTMPDGLPEVRCTISALDATETNCSGGVARWRTTALLAAGTTYNFTLLVVNPATDTFGQWRLQSFTSSGSMLDEAWLPGFAFAGSVPMALGFASQALADKDAVALVYMVLPRLRAGAQLRVTAPASFQLPPGRACEHFVAAAQAGRASVPQGLLPLLPAAWDALPGAGQPPWTETAVPLPPFASCSLDGSILIDLFGPVGGRTYVMAVSVYSPAVQPAGSENIWKMEVWMQSAAVSKLLYVASAPGFALVPKLQQSTVYPFRSLGDAYLTQSLILPPGASLISLRVEFVLPSTDSLGARLELRLAAPPGFQLGSSGGCEVRSLLLGQDFVPESASSCSAAEQQLRLSARPSGGASGEVPYKAEIFPALPPVDAEGPDRFWDINVYTCNHRGESLSDLFWQEADDCQLLAASTGIPSWPMSGYLHVDRLVVTDASAAEPGSVLGQWLQQQTWVQQNELLSLEIRGLRINGVLSKGGALRVRAPEGFEFRHPFDAGSVIAPRQLATSVATARELELYFQDDLVGDDGALDLTVAVAASAAFQEPAEPWKLEMQSPTGELLAVQGNIGSFDRLASFRHLLVASSPAGEFFDLAVFLAMPETLSLVGTSNFLRLQAPVFVEFAPCGQRDEELAPVPSALAGALQNERVDPALVRPLPSFSACTAGGDVLTVHLGGRRRGSGRGALVASAVYGFVWPARRVARQVPWRPLGQSGIAGPADSELVLAGERADSPWGSWHLAAFSAGRRLLASTAEGQLAVRDLAPAWMLATRPYYGQESLLLIVFTLGGYGYPPASKLRLTLQPHGAVEGLRFLSCERQQSLLRRAQWREPLRLTQVPAETLEDATTSVPGDSQLALARFSDCAAGGSGNSSLAGEVQLTLSMETWLTPPGDQYMLQTLGVRHALGPSTRQLLSLEVVAGLAEQQLAAAQLRTYALAQEMLLTRWAHSSSASAAENLLDIEFQPATSLLDRQAAAAGFILVAPPTYLFTEKSCEELVLERSQQVENLQTGVTESKPLFLKDPPLCEVATSDWLSSDGYYQHQLTIFLPPLVGFRSDLRYRLKVLVLNPPMSLSDNLMMQFLREKRSPKFSPSPLLTPSLNIWRISTFVWESGDSGTGEVPYTLAGNSLGRRGMRKLDEVAWTGFELT
ncbi:unnamed protein product [Effrenium voratum]|nr:unnamed protein product [Effrenium voratum]